MKFVLLLLFTILAVTLGAPHHHHPDHSEETETGGTGETEETVADSVEKVEKHHAHHVDPWGSGITWYINYMKFLIKFYSPYIYRKINNILS